MGQLEEQANAIKKARWDFFESGLRQDWATIDTVRGALRLVEAAAHVKRVAYFRDMSVRTTAAIQQYMAAHVQPLLVSKLELIKAPLTQWYRAIGARYGVETSAILTLGYIDLNAPALKRPETQTAVPANADDASFEVAEFRKVPGAQ